MSAWLKQIRLSWLCSTLVSDPQLCVCVCYHELDCLHDSHGLDDR